MRRPWLLVVVRAWHLNNRRIIRMTMSNGSDPIPRTAYVMSNRSAADRLLLWLEQEATKPEADDASEESAATTDDDA